MSYRIMKWSGVVLVASIIYNLLHDVIGPGVWWFRAERRSG